VKFPDLFEKISEEFSSDQITNQPTASNENKISPTNNDFDSDSFDQKYPQIFKKESANSFLNKQNKKTNPPSDNIENPLNEIITKDQPKNVEEQFDLTICFYQKVLKIR
jgi:hypothetical protein